MLVNEILRFCYKTVSLNFFFSHYVIPRSKIKLKLIKILNKFFSAAAAAKLLQSCPTLCDPIDGIPPGSSVQWNSLGKSTGVGCHFLLQQECIP